MYSNKFVACVKADGKVLREKGEDVYLPFGSEYTLFFKNEHNRKVQINVEIDGQDVLFGKALLLDAGDTMDLKGFVRDQYGDDNRAFKFITKTQEISDFRGDRAEDGLIKITYQFEKESIADSLEGLLRKSTYTYEDNPWSRGGFVDNCGYHQTFGSTNISHSTLDTMNVTCSASASASYDSNVSNSIQPQGSVNLRAAQISEDPGITVEGSATGQSFKRGHIGSLEHKRHIMIFQLKGLTEVEQVEVPVTVKTKKQCPSCGKKWKSSFEYCPHDGTFLRFP
jgi:hypothetical protein